MRTTAQENLMCSSRTTKYFIFCFPDVQLSPLGRSSKPHSGELKHALPQAGGPTQSQLSRPMTSGHHLSIEHRLRRKNPQFNSDAGNETYLKENTRKKKKGKNDHPKTLSTHPVHRGPKIGFSQKEIVIFTTRTSRRFSGLGGKHKRKHNEKHEKKKRKDEGKTIKRKRKGKTKRMERKT